MRRKDSQKKVLIPFDRNEIDEIIRSSSSSKTKSKLVASLFQQEEELERLRAN